MPPGLLTPRQEQIAALVYKGCTNREIGETLGISAETVKRHLAEIMERSTCKSRSELCSRRIDVLEREVARLRG